MKILLVRRTVIVQAESPLALSIARNRED